jgi:WD40 repeat protein
VRSAAFSPDGTQLLSASYDQTLKLWDAHTGTCLRTFQGHSGGVWSAAFSPDGTQLLSASGDQTLKLWDAHTGTCLRTFMHGGGNEWAVLDFSQNQILHASEGAWRILGWRSWDESQQRWRIQPPAVPC